MTGWWLGAVALLFTGGIALADGSAGSGSISITSQVAVVENFNGLSNGVSPSSALPAGWYLTEIGTGGAADGSYVVATGSGNAGGAYSFGADAAGDRALGSLGSGTVTPIHYGVMLVNRTGSVIQALAISYTGEVWRRGTAVAAAGEGLAFSYSTNATSLTAGSFTAVPALNFASPGDACSATQNVAVDGNSANCRKLITFTITGLAIPNGQSLWLRWTDVDTAGSDDGVAIDDFSVTAGTSSISISPTATGSASPNPTFRGQQTTLSGTITPGQNPVSASFQVTCDLTAIGGATSQPLAVTGNSFSYTATVAANTLPNGYAMHCTVADDQGRSTAFDIALAVLLALDTACGAPATPIDAVQGAGLTSPLTGQRVDLEGIVVGAFQGAARLSGFYLEEPVETRDRNPATSEGIFVFTNSPAVSPGDRVRIRGTVSEFTSATGTLVSNLTELSATSNATVCSSGNSLPPMPTLALPVSHLADYERYEGMRVQFEQQLVVTGNFSLGTFGQIDLAPSVLYQPTQTPGSTSWAAAADLNSRSRITLDDGSTSSNAALGGGGLAPYPAPGLSSTNTLRVGALVNPGDGYPVPLTGILDDRFGSYRLEPTAPVSFSNAPNPRPDTAAIANAPRGRFRVASANVLNFFTTLGSRGAATAEELANQRTKIVEELRKLNADIYGLSEVQNFANGNISGGSYTNAALSDLTASMATATGRNYQFLDTLNSANVAGGDIAQNGTDAIRNVLIYDPAKVIPVGPAALFYQNDTNRPSLAQTFQPASGAKAASQTFTVVVNHFRSKGSTCGGSSDDPFQGNCNGLRLLMSNNVRNWLSGNPTHDPAAAGRKYLLIGDFNAYFGEDPIQAFLGAGGYTDLIDLLLGPHAASYNFDSQAAYLDHAFSNAAMLPLIKNIVELHVNADEPASLQALDSNLKSRAAQTAYFAADEFASSDHDPFIVALNPLPGDLNDDGIVDASDRRVLVRAYGKSASRVDRRMDYDGDGMIGPGDYRLWLNFYRAFAQ